MNITIARIIKHLKAELLTHKNPEELIGYLNHLEEELKDKVIINKCLIEFEEEEMPPRDSGIIEIRLKLTTSIEESAYIMSDFYSPKTRKIAVDNCKEEIINNYAFKTNFGINELQEEFMYNKLRLEIKDKIANIMDKYVRKKTKLFQEELVDWFYDPKEKTLKYYYAIDVKIKIEQ